MCNTTTVKHIDCRLLTYATLKGSTIGVIKYLIIGY